MVAVIIIKLGLSSFAKLSHCCEIMSTLNYDNLSFVECLIVGWISVIQCHYNVDSKIAKENYK